MLNNKGRYYAKQIRKEMTTVVDYLCEKNIMKTKDLGGNTNLAAISSSLSTDFLATETAAILVRGYSESIRSHFYCMGEENLANFPELRKYYDELNKVYDSKSNNKAFEYYKLIYRFHYDVMNCLEEAILKAERSENIPAKRKGSNFYFETCLDNIIFLTLNNEDYSKVGLRLPNSDNKFIQIDRTDIFKGKVSETAANNPSSANVSVIINFVYNDEKELAKKLYPIVSTYDNKPIEITKMIPATEFISILKEEYNATSSNVVVDMEAFYEQADKIYRQNLQEAVFFVTGKNKCFRIMECEKKGEWPFGVIKATSTSDLTNVTLLTKRNFDLMMARRNEKNQQAAKKSSVYN